MEVDDRHRRARDGGRWWRPTRGKIIAAAIVLVVVIALAVLRAMLPDIIRNQLISGVRHDCPECTIEIGRVEVAVLHGTVALADVHVASRADADLNVDVRADRLEVRSDLFSFLTGTIHVRAAIARRPRVTVRRDERAESGGNARRSPLLSLPRMRVDGVSLSDGHVEYIATNHERPARLRVDAIDGHVGAFGTRPGLGTRGVVLDAHGVLEHEGTVTLSVQLDPLVPHSNAHVELDLRDQSLDRFNDFLRVSSGIELRGHVDRAHASATVEHGTLRGELRGEYAGLDVHFHRSDNRGGIEAALFNAARGLVLRTAYGGRVGLSAERQPDEVLPSLVWRAVKSGIEQLVRR